MTYSDYSLEDFDNSYGRKSRMLGSKTKISGLGRLSGLQGELGGQDINQYLKPKNKKKK